MFKSRLKIYNFSEKQIGKKRQNTRKTVYLNIKAPLQLRCFKYWLEHQWNSRTAAVPHADINQEIDCGFDGWFQLWYARAARAGLEGFLFSVWDSEVRAGVLSSLRFVIQFKGDRQADRTWLQTEEKNACVLWLRRNQTKWGTLLL